MKKILLFLGFLSTIVFMCSCSAEKDNLEVYGSEISRFYDVYADNFDMIYEIPIISNQKVVDFSVIDIKGEGDFLDHITYDSISEEYQYKDWYYYILYFKTTMPQKNAIKFDLDSIDVSINGKNCTLDISEFHLSNIKGEYNGRYSVKDDVLLYEYGGPNKMLPGIGEDHLEDVSFLISQDCVINDFGYADFVNIKNIEIRVNDVLISSDFPLEVKQGDILSLTYNLEYSDDISEYSLIKTTIYVTYSINGNEYIFTDPQGSIIVKYSDDQYIKDYIDTIDSAK